MKKQTKIGLVLAAAAVISVSVASLVSARGWAQQGSDWYYVDNNGDYVTETIQSSGNAKFYLGEDGAMVRDYFLEEYDDNTYYFGSNGAMVTNTWVAIDSSIVENQGDYVPDNYWYYFQASGKAMKAASGQMKKAINDTQVALENIVDTLKNTSNGLISASGVVSKETDATGIGVDNVSSAADELANASTSMAQDVSDISMNMTELSSIMERSVESANSLSVASSEIENATDNGNHVVESLADINERSYVEFNAIFEAIDDIKKSGEKISDFVLRGKSGSAAEKYAQSNGFTFIPS